MKKYLLGLFVLAIGALALATVTSDQQYIINHINSQAFRVQLGTILAAQKSSVKINYDKNTFGGKVGTIDLGVTLPPHVIVTRALIDVVIPPTSTGSATLNLQLVNPGDIKGTTAKGSFVGIMDGVETGSAGTALKVASAKSLKLIIGTASLASGNFNVFLDYVLTN